MIKRLNVMKIRFSFM